MAASRVVSLGEPTADANTKCQATVEKRLTLPDDPEPLEKEQQELPKWRTKTLTQSHSMRSQASSVGSIESASSIFSQIRQVVSDSAPIQLPEESKWGPASTPGTKPRVKDKGFKFLPPTVQDSPAEGEDSAPESPKDLRSPKGIIKARHLQLQRDSMDPSFPIGRQTKSPSTPVSPRGGPTSPSFQGAKLSRQRSTISLMSADSQAASKAVDQALALSDMLLGGNDLEDDTSQSETASRTPTFRRSPSGISARGQLRRSASGISVKSQGSKASKPSSRISDPVLEVVDDESDNAEGRDFFFSEDCVTETPQPFRVRIKRRLARLCDRQGSGCSSVAWLVLRLLVVLLSLGTLLAQIFLRDHELGNVLVCILASCATCASLLLSTFSGSASVFRNAEKQSSNGHVSGMSNIDGKTEAEARILDQIPALLETAATGIASLQNQLEEVKLWDQLREEQEGLLRGFNKIVTQEVSLNKGSEPLTVIIAEECTETRKELSELCGALDLKCKVFSNLKAAERALLDSTQSVDSLDQRDHILKDRPGANGRNWISCQFADCIKGDADNAQPKVVLLGATCLPAELPLPSTWLETGHFLVLTGKTEQLNEAANLLPEHQQKMEVRECWRVQGISDTMQAPFTKEAINAAVVEAKHTCHREEYLLLESIGQGTWGNVFRAKRLGDGNVLALKMVNSKRMQSKFKDAMEREVKFLREFRWPTVLFLLDAWVSGSMQCMLLPLLDGGDLAKEKKQAWTADTPLSFNSVADWYAQTLHGLCYLHWRGVVHADIKPGNLLLGSDRRVLLIGDFGSAQLLPGNGPHPARRNFVRMPFCTPSYASPESLLQDKHFPGSDIWGLAITFYELITLKDMLHSAVEDAKLQLEVLNFEDLLSGGSKNLAVGAVAALRSCKMPGTLPAEILEMVCRDPLKRPSAANLVMRSGTSERLQMVLKETGSLSDTVEHFKDFANIIVESEEAADVEPPQELEPVEYKSGEEAVKPRTLRRSLTATM